MDIRIQYAGDIYIEVERITVGSCLIRRTTPHGMISAVICVKLSKAIDLHDWTMYSYHTNFTSSSGRPGRCELYCVVG